MAGIIQQQRAGEGCHHVVLLANIRTGILEVSKSS